MNENDLRDCFAMFAMFSRSFTDTKESDAKICYQIADMMLEARKPKEEGIAAVKRIRKVSEKRDA